MRYSDDLIWVWNLGAQTSAFALMAHLTASLRRSLMRERELSRVDPLTGLANTRAFYEDATRAAAACRRRGRPIALAYVDVDDFKRVNDSRGHAGGDEVLRNVGKTLASAIRREDSAARVGGDEFVMLLPETDADGARNLLERVCALLAAAQGDAPSAVTFSIGAVVFEQAPADVEALVGRADALMYEAKRAGKNRVTLAVEPVDPSS